MGRGRKGIIVQSERKTKASGGLSAREMPMVYFSRQNREIKKNTRT